MRGVGGADARDDGGDPILVARTPSAVGGLAPAVAVAVVVLEGALLTRWTTQNAMLSRPYP